LIGTVLILSILLNQFLEKHLRTGRGFAKSKQPQTASPPGSLQT
jgi:hypothetical protein